MDEIMKQLDLGAFDVRFIVIYGMGGIGKTTLAKAVFRKISPEFQDHCCFLGDVRTHEMRELQSRLLSDVLNINPSIIEGVDMIKTNFHGKKVLIVLDDIDNQDQIMRLAGEPDWYGRGSRIIITTRTIEFLVEEGEDGDVPTSDNEHFSFYPMPEMNRVDALQLFCEHALGRAKTPPDYVDISTKIVNALGRLPLALNVVGSTLRGRRQSTWEHVLCKLKKVMNKDVKDKLMISYEALEPNQQQIYLDIACFFINQEKIPAIKYWDALFGYPTEIEIKILRCRSLIKITEYDELRMHNQLRDLGRDIVKPENPRIHRRGIRLWSWEDAFREVQSKMGNKNVVALNLGIPKSYATYNFKREEFARMVKLRFLHLNHGNFEGDFKDLFTELRWLSWNYFPSEFPAINLGLKNLVVLKLFMNGFTKDLGGWCQIMLQELEISCANSRSLARLPSGLRCLTLADVQSAIKWSRFSNLENLSTLSIDGYSLKTLTLPPFLKEIQCLTLERLPQVTEIQGLGELRSLQELSIKYCNSLKRLKKSDLSKLRHLKRLRLHECGSLERVLGVPESCFLYPYNCPRLNRDG